MKDLLKVTSARSIGLIFFTATLVLFLVPSATDINAQEKSNFENYNSLDPNDAIYNSNVSTFLGSKNISLTPNLTTEANFFEYGFLKGVGNVTNNQTFLDTYLTDDLQIGTGNGTIQTSDGQSIAWMSRDIGKLVEDRWIFYGVMHFNQTDSESLSILNDSIALSKSSTRPMETEYIWLLEK